MHRRLTMCHGQPLGHAPRGRALLRWLCVPFLAAIAACGGGGGGGGDPAAAQASISGRAIKGPVAGGIVVAYAVNALGREGSVLATTRTDGGGNYSLSLDYAGPLLLEVTGGTYADEATGASVGVPGVPGSGLQAVISNITPGSPITVQITPLTTLAAARAQALPGGLTVTNIDAANSRVGTYFGGINILTTLPIDPTVSGSAKGVAQASIDYGLVLAGMSEEAKTMQLSDAFDLVTAFVQDFSDGSFNGQAGAVAVQVEGTPLDPSAGTTRLASAVSAFSASPLNKSGGTVSASLVAFLADPPAAYTVGGTLSGLSGTLVLTDNNVDPLTLKSDGPFTFPTAIAVGSPYVVTVASQPTGQTCSVASGSGTMGIEPVSDVTVTCAAAQISLPNVVGKSQAQAEATLTTSGLVVGSVVRQFNSSVAEGLVISQSPAPAPGALVAYGTLVSLVVSEGPQSAAIAVPSLIGLVQADAEAAVTAAGLVIGTETTGFDLTVPAGSVSSQSPAPSTLVPPKDPVNLVISLGRAFINVPSFAGVSLVTAEQQIAAADFVLGTVTAQSSISVPIGAVISQSPVAGTIAREQDTIDLWVASLTPTVIGLDQSDAEATLTALNLVVGTETQQNSDTIALGSVISQDPAPGSPITPQTSVNLVISAGPAGGS